MAVSVIGCVQDPRKETVPQRGLYTVRALLAVNEEDDVSLVLDRGARDRGAKAEKITLKASPSSRSTVSPNQCGSGSAT